MSKERIAIIGAGRFGSAIALALSQKGVEVLVIDSELSVIQDISDDVAYAVCTDATNKRALQAENIEDFDVVVVAIGNDFQASLLCTANLLDLNMKRIICRTLGKSQQIILEKMGITEFLFPEDAVGAVVAEKLINPNILSYLQLPDDYKIAEILTPQRLVGLKLGLIEFRNNYRLSLITIRRLFNKQISGSQEDEEHIIGVPENTEVIQEKDVFVVFGLAKDIDNFIKINQ